MSEQVLSVQFDANIQGFQQAMQSVQQSVRQAGDTVSGSLGGAESSARKGIGGIKSVLGGLGGMVAGAFAVGAVTNFGQTMVNTTADIQALNSQYSQVMGSMKASTDKYLNQMSTQWNKHPNELKGAYMQYVAILKSKGVAEEQAHTLAKQTLERTVDANAFANEDMSATTARFMGMMKGEYDSLDTAMINLSATMLNDMSMEQYGKKFDELSVTQQETLKVQEALRQHTAAGVFGQGATEADSYNNNLAMLKNTWAELLAKMGSPVIGIVNTALKGLTTMLQNIDFEAIKAKFAAFFAYLQQGGTAFESIKTSAMNVFNSLQAFIVPKLEAYKQIIMTVLNQIKAFWEQNGTAILTKLQSTWSQLMGIVQPILMDMSNFINQKLAAIKQFWEQNGTQILAAVKNIFNGIMAVIDFVMPAIKFVIESVWTAIKGIIDGALNVIMGLVKTFSGLFTGDFSKMWEGVKQLFSGAVQFVRNLMTITFYGKIIQVVKNLAKGFVEIIKGNWTSIKNLFTGGADDATNLVTRLKDKASSIFTSMKDKFVNVARSLWNGIKNIFSSMKDGLSATMNAIKSSASNIWNSIKSSVTNTISSLKDGAVSSFNTIKSRATSIFNGVKTAITSPIESAKRTVLGIIDAIKGAFSRMSIKIPKPKLPHISVSMRSKSIGGISIPYPDFDLNYYASGGIFKGSKGGSLIGIAENGGDEAVLPLSNKTRMRPFAEAVASMMPANKNSNASPSGDVYNLTLQIENMNGSKQDADDFSKRIQDNLRRMKGVK